MFIVRGSSDLPHSQPDDRRRSRMIARQDMPEKRAAATTK
jgi:hypothetical protein